MKAKTASYETSGAPVFFASAQEFRAWLDAHSQTAVDLTVGFHKVGSGKPSLTWPESVDEALCVGWIDSVRRRIDDEAYQIRFTPRRQGSMWSAVNIAKVKVLIAQGRMKPAGLEAYRKRLERKSRIYSYEQAGSAGLARDELKTFKQSKAAWASYEKLPPGYRKTMIHWVVSAKQPTTRARRLARFIASCAAGLRFLP